MSISSRLRAAALAVALGLAGLLTVAPSAAADTAAGADSCDDGVLVVVDFTDLGGEVEVGCADGDPASGREALESAGFPPTDSIPGMICAVDARPDPCPDEFDGSFWAYWTTDGGEWVSHTAGADGVDPAPGDVEGWRYNDGATGPGLSPTEAAATLASVTADDDAAEPAVTSTETDDAGTEDGADADATAAVDPATDAAQEDPSGGATVWFVIAGLAVVAAGVAFLVRTRKR